MARRGVAQLRAAHALHLEAKHHVLQRGEPGQELGELEHHAAVEPAAGHLAAVHRHLAVRGGLEPHDNAQRRGLAAAGRPDEGDNLAVVHGEADAVERLHDLHGAVDAQREALGDFDKADLTHLRAVLDRPSGETDHPSILEKSATARVASRISLSSLRRFSRSLALSAPSATLTVTLSKKASTCGRSFAIARMAVAKSSAATALPASSLAVSIARASAHSSSWR